MSRRFFIEQRSETRGRGSPYRGGASPEVVHVFERRFWRVGNVLTALVLLAASALGAVSAAQMFSAKTAVLALAICLVASAAAFFEIHAGALRRIAVRHDTVTVERWLWPRAVAIPIYDLAPHVHAHGGIRLGSEGTPELYPNEIGSPTDVAAFLDELRVVVEETRVARARHGGGS